MKVFCKLSILSAIFSFVFSLSASSQNAWINEIHYSDLGTDTNEFVEVVIHNPGNYVLSNFAVILYNGNNGESYDTKTLDQFTAGITVNGFTIYYFMYPTNGIQNGEPDGLALAYNDVLIPGQFLSYEGAFLGVGGPADGIMSVDIVVLEGGEPDGSSLQLSGSGSDYSAFTWQPPAAETHGQENNNQDLMQVGIVEESATLLNIFPNPNSGTFKLTNPTSEAMEISIYSINGQLIISKMLRTGQNELRLDNPECGIYFIKSDKAGTYYSGKIVIN